MLTDWAAGRDKKGLWGSEKIRRGVECSRRRREGGEEGSVPQRGHVDGKGGV